jgi:cytochrome b
MNTPMTPADTHIRVWDLPTRLFHWALAICVIGALVTANVGGRWMDWHMPFGVCVLALLVFRLVWGIVGSRYARWKSLMFRPRDIWRYLREPQPRQTPGHSPLGALAVFALFLVLTIQAVTGLFASDNILTDGPLNQYVSNQTARLFTSIHVINKIALLVLIGLHLLAILIYTLRGKQLVKAMITGNKASDMVVAGAIAARDDLNLRLRALVLAVILAAMAWWLIDLGRSAGFSF